MRQAGIQLQDDRKAGISNQKTYVCLWLIDLLSSKNIIATKIGMKRVNIEYGKIAEAISISRHKTINSYE